MQNVSGLQLVEIDSLVLHLNEWEVHSLRGLITVMVIQTQLYAREHPHDKEAQELADKFVALKVKQESDQILELQAELVRDVTRRQVQRMSHIQDRLFVESEPLK